MARRGAAADDFGDERPKDTPLARGEEANPDCSRAVDNHRRGGAARGALHGCEKVGSREAEGAARRSFDRGEHVGVRDTERRRAVDTHDAHAARNVIARRVARDVMRVRCRARRAFSRDAVHIGVVARFV